MHLWRVIWSIFDSLWRSGSPTVECCDNYVSGARIKCCLVRASGVLVLIQVWVVHAIIQVSCASGYNHASNMAPLFLHVREYLFQNWNEVFQKLYSDMSRNDSPSFITGFELDDWGSILSKDRYLFLSHHVQTGLGAQHIFYSALAGNVWSGEVVEGVKFSTQLSPVQRCETHWAVLTLHHTFFFCFVFV